MLQERPGLPKKDWRSVDWYISAPIRYAMRLLSPTVLRIFACLSKSTTSLSPTERILARPTLHCPLFRHCVLRRATRFSSTFRRTDGLPENTSRLSATGDRTGGTSNFEGRSIFGASITSFSSSLISLCGYASGSSSQWVSLMSSRPCSACYAPAGGGL